MGIVFFLICIMHNILYNMKDALIITSEGAGAEAIPFIQLWMLFPMICVATLCVTSLMRRYGIATVIQVVLGFFLVSFVLFACILFPCREVLTPTTLTDYLTDVLPSGFKGMIGMLRYWIFSSFFVLAELWGGMVTSVIFWSLANEITSVSEATHSYSWIRVGGAIGCSVGGQVPMLANWIVPEASIYALIVMIVGGCVITMVLLKWVAKQGVEEEVSLRLTTPRNGGAAAKRSLWMQVQQILRSRHLMYLAAIVIGYNVAMNLFELVWKAELKEFYPDFNDYNAFLGHASTICGFLTVGLAIATPYMLERYGWTCTALTSPILHILTAAGFFGILIFQDILPFDANVLLGIAIIVGAVQFSIGRAIKHSFFDVSKDLAFIPLPSDVKAQGKAAVDGFGSRAGRSAASLVHQVLLILFTTVSGGLPLIGLLVMIVAGVWIAATRGLGKELSQLVPESLREAKKEEPIALPAAA